MIIRPKKTVNLGFTVLIIFLSLPATAILASWNALPGSILYPVKIGLEKTALALTPQSFFESELRIKLVNRRAQEANNVLVKSPQNTDSLDALIAEAQAAEYTTVNLKSKQRQKAIQNLVTSLKQTEETLETTKQTVAQSQPTIVYQTETVYQTKTVYQNSPDPTPTTQVSVPSSSPDNKIPEEESGQVINSITQTQQQIHDIIQDLETLEKESQPETSIKETLPQTPSDSEPTKPPSINNQKHPNSSRNKNNQDKQQDQKNH